MAATLPFGVTPIANSPNLETVLRHAGLTLANVVRLSYYTRDVGAFLEAIPMDRERVLVDRTGIVRDGRIAEIGASGAVTVPAVATRIDGRGKFFIPTLAEMHAHVPVEREQAERVAFLYVANGIGTIRSMLGDPSHFALKDRAARGEIVGPAM